MFNLKYLNKFKYDFEILKITIKRLFSFPWTLEAQTGLQGVQTYSSEAEQRQILILIMK